MILVTGISGVGKTHLLEQFLRRHPSFVRLGASALLHRARHNIDNLDTASAAENQRFLMQALTNAMHEARPRTLVDGHAVIETRNGVYEVPDMVVVSLRPQLIATVFDEDEASLENRRRQKGRQSFLPLSQLQTAEIERSRRWSKVLEVPFALVRSGAVEDFEYALAQSGIDL